MSALDRTIISLFEAESQICVTMARRASLWQISVTLLNCPPSRRCKILYNVVFSANKSRIYYLQQQQFSPSVSVRCNAVPNFLIQGLSEARRRLTSGCSGSREDPEWPDVDRKRTETTLLIGYKDTAWKFNDRSCCLQVSYVLYRVRQKVLTRRYTIAH